MADEYELMKKVLKLKKKGRVIDMGCGYGDDAVFLAKHGFEVTCVDNSESAIYETKKIASIGNVFIRIFKKDLREFRIDEKFDVALCSGVMHFISKEESLKLIQRMKKMTVQGGLNIIEGGVVKDEEKEKERGYFRKDELRMIYHGWDILEYKETSTANMPSWHECVLLIARKPFK